MQIARWTSAFLKNDPPRSKSIVVTVFGDSIEPHGGAVWLGSLIDLLAPFGISERLVRTSVYRLAEEHWIEAERKKRQSLYRLTPSGRRRFEHAYRKIYSRSDQRWQGEWTFLIITPATLTVKQRLGLRKELSWEGFRIIAPGIFAHPKSDTEALQDILDRTRMRKKVLVCSVADIQHIGTRPLRNLIEERWKLSSVINRYQRFIEAFGTLPAFFSSADSMDAEQAFVIRTLLIHSFRRVLLHDPLLPVELLPDTWPGTRAYELCKRIYQLTCKSAEQHLLSALRRRDRTTPVAAPYFYERFGGLTPTD